jgi:hypothetical protein
LPRAVASEDQVRAAPDDILRWQDIARFAQFAKFLSYIVDARLRGREETINAYSIAVDIFDGPPSFDPQSDPIVRVRAHAGVHARLCARRRCRDDGDDQEQTDRRQRARGVARSSILSGAIAATTGRAHSAQ